MQSTRLKLDDKIEKLRLQEENLPVILPWNKKYKWWWSFTVLCAFSTIFTETYQIAFGRAGITPISPSFYIEYTLVAVFVIDIIVVFNVAYYDENNKLVYDRSMIAKRYRKGKFWLDVIGVFPFYAILLAMAGEIGENSTVAQYLALIRLTRLVRLHRMVLVFDILQYNSKISLLWLTVTRNFVAAMVWTHLSACIMYFIARQYNFDDDNTWFGIQTNLNAAERYITALYWSVVTFTTVGYGDYSPVNAAEQIWDMFYMLVNMLFHAWIIGSITLLIVKGDEQTGAYREALQKVNQYAEIHEFDRDYTKRLRNQLKLEFQCRELADEEVLSVFPNTVQRKVLRKLYFKHLLKTSLMKGVRQQFVDAFLGACTIEMFSPNEEIIQRGSIASDLYLIVEGTAKIDSNNNKDLKNVQPTNSFGSNDNGFTSDYINGNNTSIADSEMRSEHGMNSNKKIQSGEFVNEIGFFTDSTQADTVRTISVCKILILSRSAYKVISQDHPGSVGKILQNLLAKVEKMADELGVSPKVNLPTRMEVLQAGSVFDIGDETSYHNDVDKEVRAVQTQASLTAVRDLVQMHMNKQKDDHTTRFLFAASRGDTSTISLMCEQGFDPNHSDYDQRTALMVASMKGHVETVTKLIEFSADPNLVDMHGTSPLYEAVRNGNDDVIDVLLSNNAKLGMDESKSASILCQAVFDGDVVTLRRLLKAGININASDYDKRAAVHIAAAEGNVAALKVLVEFNADLNIKDRWNNTVRDEAKGANAGHVIEYLDSLEMFHMGIDFKKVP